MTAKISDRTFVNMKIRLPIVRSLGWKCGLQCHVAIEGGVTPIVNTVHFHQLHIVKNGRTALFLAAGFARVAIKKLLLSGVPNRTPPVK